MLVLLQSAAPASQRLKAAIDEFNKSISIETLAMSAVVLVIALVWLYTLKPAYTAWYMRKRKKFED